MANITLPASCTPGGAAGKAPNLKAVSGEAIAIGMAFALDSSGVAWKADPSHATRHQVRGIACTAATAAGQTISGFTNRGLYVNLGASGGSAGYSGLTPNAKVYLSATAGRLTHSLADLDAADRIVEVGYAWSARALVFDPKLPEGLGGPILLNASEAISANEVVALATSEAALADASDDSLKSGIGFALADAGED